MSAGIEAHQQLSPTPPLHQRIATSSTQGPPLAAGPALRRRPLLAPSHVGTVTGTRRGHGGAVGARTLEGRARLWRGGLGARQGRLPVPHSTAPLSLGGHPWGVAGMGPGVTRGGGGGGVLRGVRGGGGAPLNS